MFMHRIARLLPAFWLAVALSAPALAQDAVDMQSFKPSPFGNDLLTTESGEGLPQWTWNVGLWPHYQHNPLVYRDPDSREVTRVALGNQVTADLVGGFSFFEWLNLGLALPAVLYQDGEGLVGGSAPAVAGLGDLRLVPRFQVVNVKQGMFALSLLPVLTVPTGQFFDRWMGDSNFNFMPTVAASTRWKWFTVAGNAYYRLRQDADVGSLTAEHELGFRLGGSVFVWPEYLALLGEVYGATPAWHPFESAQVNKLDLVGGIRFFTPLGVDITVGGGSNPTRGFGTPDFRIFAAAVYTWKPAPDADGDGVPDAEDACPQEPGPAANNGCPDTDRDGDGVVDRLDQCVDQPGPADNNGCPKDKDGDGVLDNVDRCPDQPGPAGNDGCPDADADGDGIPDRLDKCVDQPEDKDTFQDDDGCPDPDNDADGIPDDQDQCPNEAGPAENKGCPDKDRDGDGVVDRSDACPDEAGPLENRGCPDQDRDGDGIVDRLDNCPDEAGTKENNGCKAKQLVVLTTEKIQILDKVYFAFNKADIQKRSFKMLDQVASVLKSHPEIKKIRVEGHTDNKGKAEYNKKLSQLRADAVKAYLIKAGVEEARLEAVGFGMEKPIDTNDTNAGRANNRRVEFNIVRE
ncbi:MAG: OmpA family protein [Deltaproteobacteria bacterium]|nr:OmpA family protein [Deltaproteobacteria bacterium]